MPTIVAFRIWALLVFLTTAAVAGPKVVCFGDSITKRGYDEVLEGLVDVEASNAGVGGHNSAEGLHRLEKDVLALKPDIVVVLFGTNDLRADSKKFIPEMEYRKNLQKIVDRVEAAGGTLVICSLPPIDAEAFFKRHEKSPFEEKGGLAKLIESYRRAAGEVAKENGLPFVDLQKLLKKTPEWMSADGVHPSPKGTRLIAGHIAKVLKPLLVQQSD